MRVYVQKKAIPESYQRITDMALYL